MNNKEAIIKKILESEVYKQSGYKWKVSFWVKIKASIVALRFLPEIIQVVIKHGR